MVEVRQISLSTTSDASRLTRLARPPSLFEGSLQRRLQIAWPRLADFSSHVQISSPKSKNTDSADSVQTLYASNDIKSAPCTPRRPAAGTCCSSPPCRRSAPPAPPPARAPLRTPGALWISACCRTSGRTCCGEGKNENQTRGSALSMRNRTDCSETAAAATTHCSSADNSISDRMQSDHPHISPLHYRRQRREPSEGQAHQRKLLP